MVRFILGSFLALSLIIFSGCGKNSTEPSSTGTLKINLTDSPADYDAVNIVFSEISAHINDEWITVRGEPIKVNLLEWNNGKSIVIGTAEVPSGHYTQIRLKIDSAEVVVDGMTHGMFVPSGAQTGLKFIAEFNVNAGSTYELVIDFDAHRSVVVTGPPGNPTGYILKPTVRVVPWAITGSISATVTNPENAPVAYAFFGSDTVTSSMVDVTTGEFMLAFLEAQAYTVFVQDTISRSFVQNDVEVTVGEDNNLGNISLQ